MVISPILNIDLHAMESTSILPSFMLKMESNFNI